MSDDQTQAAVKATAQLITDDGTRAVESGMDPIAVDEVIVEPNPADYFSPTYLQKTAPQLAPAFAVFLGELRDLNARFTGELTVEAQATLSLTGEHEWLEEKFLDWCQTYFKIRGSLDRLNPKNGNDPSRLYRDCFEEFSELYEKRLVQPGTINSSVLNLSQRFMLSAFAEYVMGPDLKHYAETGRDRFSDATKRQFAAGLVAEYTDGVQAFTAFLLHIIAHLPAEYAPVDSLEWRTDIQTKLTRRAEDLSFLRYVLSSMGIKKGEVRQLAPDIWARFAWDVYHGGSIGTLLTSSSLETSDERATNHLIAIRRDGFLSHREYSWVRVQPEYRPEERWMELAACWYVLDKLTSPLYEAWGRLDPGPVITRGLEPDATEDEKTAALAVALAEPDLTVVETLTTRQPRLPQLRITRIKSILTSEFECEWTMAKGSEQKVYRQSGKLFTFGCHGADRLVHPVQLKNCLKRLGISLRNFIDASR